MNGITWHKFVVVGSFFTLAMGVQANPEQQVDMEFLMSLSLEELSNITVASASGVEESYRDAPAAMVVITGAEIKQRGYTDLIEVLSDAPGFDVMVANGTTQIVAYQRGYRTPFSQRTLFLINGKVDNHLWTHEALWSRQFSMNNIERIEILYGPVGSIYGPNAFMGIVNVITHDARKQESDKAGISVQYGSFATLGLDLAARGKAGELGYSLASKIFKSDEAGLADYAPWGYTDANLLTNRTNWGPILDHGFRNVPYSQYADRSDEWSLMAELAWRDFKFTYLDWEIKNGYGVWYPFDLVQPNQSWNKSSTQYFLEHEQEAWPDVKVKSLLQYREGRVWGGWVEAFPDWDPGMSDFSYISISDWNSLNASWQFRQDYDWRLSARWRLGGGIKYEAKQLTQAYDLCGYWSTAFCSSNPDRIGPYGLGQGVGHSSDPVYVILPGTLAGMPAENQVDTSDKGIYGQGIWDWQQWRITGGVRYDKNSLYGSSVNPRTTAIYRLSDRQTLKLLYGEAFQEPAPLQLFGGWQGRAANPDLKPEKARNLELIYMWQTSRMLHDLSLFTARYQNVIKEEAANAGERRIQGLEYRGRFSLANPIGGQPDISGYLYYTYTRSEASQTYNHANGRWEDNWSRLGDIAPHKINAGLHIPLSRNFNLNLRGNYVSERLLYSRNPLRAQGETVERYTTLDLNLHYQTGPLAIALKAVNLFDAEYYHPGVEGAESGNDFSQRAQGFRNSLLPQVGRRYLLTLSWQI